LPAIEKAGSDEVHGVQIGPSNPGCRLNPLVLSFITSRRLLVQLSGTGG